MLHVGLAPAREEARGLASLNRNGHNLKRLRAEFLLRIAANDNNGRQAAYLQFPCGIFRFSVYRLRSHKSARKHLTQSTGI